MTQPERITSGLQEAAERRSERAVERTEHRVDGDIYARR